MPCDESRRVCCVPDHLQSRQHRSVQSRAGSFHGVTERGRPCHALRRGILTRQGSRASSLPQEMGGLLLLAGQRAHGERERERDGWSETCPPARSLSSASPQGPQADKPAAPSRWGRGVCRSGSSSTGSSPPDRLPARPCRPGHTCSYVMSGSGGFIVGPFILHEHISEAALFL